MICESNKIHILKRECKKTKRKNIYPLGMQNKINKPFRIILRGENIISTRNQRPNFEQFEIAGDI